MGQRKGSCFEKLVRMMIVNREYVNARLYSFATSLRTLVTYFLFLCSIYIYIYMIYIYIYDIYIYIYIYTYRY